MLVNAPAIGDAADWEAEAERLIDRLGVRDRIVTRALRTPGDLERETGGVAGAIYGVAPHGRLGTLRQAGDDGPRRARAPAGRRDRPSGRRAAARAARRGGRRAGDRAGVSRAAALLVCALALSPAATAAAWPTSGAGISCTRPAARAPAA